MGHGRLEHGPDRESVSYEMIDIIDRGVHDGPFPLDPVGTEEVRSNWLHLMAVNSLGLGIIAGPSPMEPCKLQDNSPGSSSDN